MQVEKIGRNDPCFCGSGKKYKFCCMGKPDALPQSAELPFPTVAEAFALRALLAQSRPFRAMYEAERAKISAPLAWTNRLPMPPEIELQAIRLPASSQQIMYLRQAPVAPAHAFAAAHELMHLVLDAEGFPFVSARTEHQPLAALLNSLAQDPLIDARLAQYGFEIGKKAQKDVKAALASLQQAGPPLDRVTRLMWVLNYAGLLLECRAATPGSAQAQAGALIGWFGAHQPALMAEGDELLEAAQRIGYDTPAGLRALFEWVIQRNQLAESLDIST